jgi:hypothetical protein
MTTPLEPLLCTGSLVSDLGCLVLKYRDNGIIKVLHQRVEILAAPREIHATMNKTSKCEVNVLRSGRTKDLRMITKQSISYPLS